MVRCRCERAEEWAILRRCATMGAAVDEGHFLRRGRTRGSTLRATIWLPLAVAWVLVALHHAGDAVDVLEQEGKHGDAVFLCEQAVGLVELADVVGAVVGREGDAGEGDLDAGVLQRGDDGVEIGAGVSMGRPRRPSLPPNSTTTTAGCRARISGRRSTPSLVVLPLMPSLSTR